VRQAGKDGNIYVLDQAIWRLKFELNNVGQEIAGAGHWRHWGSPDYFDGNVYFGAAVALASEHATGVFVRQ